MSTYRLQDLPEYKDALRGTDLVLIKLLARDSGGSDIDCKTTVANLFKYVDSSKYILKGGDSVFGHLTMSNGISLQGLTSTGTALKLAWVDASGVINIGDTAAPLVLKGNSSPLVQVPDGTRYTVYHTGNRPNPSDIGAASTTDLTNYILKSGGYTRDGSGRLVESVCLQNTKALYAETSTGSWADILTINAYDTMEVGSGKCFLRLFTNEDAQLNVAGNNATLLHSNNVANYALPITGGTLKGALVIPNDLALQSLTSSGEKKALAVLKADGSVSLGNLDSSLSLQSKDNPMVNVGGTSYRLYHEGNKPSVTDIGAMSNAPNPAGAIALTDWLASVGNTRVNMAGSANISNDGSPWHVFINVKHRSGGSDGTSYMFQLEDRYMTSGNYSGFVLRKKVGSNWIDPVTLYHTGNKPTPSDIGTYTSSEIDAKATNLSTKMTRAFTVATGSYATAQTLPESSWTVVKLEPSLDTNGNFSTSDNSYTAPFDGIYEFTSKIRIVDIDKDGWVQMANQINSAVTDSSSAKWESTYNVNGSMRRMTSTNTKVIRMTKGQKMFMICWLQGSTLTIQNREFIVKYIGE